MSPTIQRRLDDTAAACARDGVRFTDIRRSVLAIILDSPGPVSAYALLDRLRESRRTAAPPTVYRALDFLLQQRLIHRVERLNAFVGCGETGPHDHPAQFLICRTCGTVAELDDHAVSHALQAAARAAGFAAAQTTVEMEGICASCSGAAATA